MSFASEYLVAPGRFPAGFEGEPWGDCSVSIALAGGPYVVTGLSQTQAENIRKRFGEFCIKDDATPGLTLSVFGSRQNAFKRVDLTGRDYTFDLDYNSNEVRFAGPRFMGRFKWGEGLQAGLWVPTERDLVSTVIFENVFRTLVAYRLLSLGGMLFHSGAVVWRGQARLFFGRSGAGKSTISGMGLKRGFEVLSDDMNALVPDGDGYIAEKLPFAGDLGQTATTKGRYPVQGIYHLQQDSENHVESMSRAAAVAALISCAPFVNADPHRYDQLSRNLESLCSRIPVKKLRFTTEGGFWDLLE